MLILIVFIFGIITSLIAKKRGLNYVWLWLIFGFLLPPFAILAALLVSPGIRRPGNNELKFDDVRKCPICAETIKRYALICRYCRAELEPPTPILLEVSGQINQINKVYAPIKSFYASDINHKERMARAKEISNAQLKFIRKYWWAILGVFIVFTWQTENMRSGKSSSILYDIVHGDSGSSEEAAKTDQKSDIVPDQNTAAATAAPVSSKSDCGELYPCQLVGIINRNDWPAVRGAIAFALESGLSDKIKWTSKKHSHNGYVLNLGGIDPNKCLAFEIGSYIGSNLKRELVSACKKSDGTFEIQ